MITQSENYLIPSQMTTQLVEEAMNFINYTAGERAGDYDFFYFYSYVYFLIFLFLILIGIVVNLIVILTYKLGENTKLINTNNTHAYTSKFISNGVRVANGFHSNIRENSLISYSNNNLANLNTSQYNRLSISVKQPTVTAYHANDKSRRPFLERNGTFNNTNQQTSVGAAPTLYQLGSYKIRKTLSSYFITSLGFCDLFMCVFNMPLCLLIESGLFNQFLLDFFHQNSQTSNTVLCKFISFFVQVPITIEIEILLTIAIDRYSSVFSPIKLYLFDKKRFKFTILLHFLCSCGLSVPNLLFYEFNRSLTVPSRLIREIEMGNASFSLNDKPELNFLSMNSYCRVKSAFKLPYTFYKWLLFILFFINLITIIVCYMKVYNHVYKVSRHQRKNSLMATSVHNLQANCAIGEKFNLGNLNRIQSKQEFENTDEESKEEKSDPALTELPNEAVGIATTAVGLKKFPSTKKIQLRILDFIGKNKKQSALPSNDSPRLNRPIKRAPRLCDVRNTTFSVSLNSTSTLINNNSNIRPLTNSIRRISCPLECDEPKLAPSCSSSSKIISFQLGLTAGVTAEAEPAPATTAPPTTDLAVAPATRPLPQRSKSIKCIPNQASRTGLISRIRRFSENPNMASSVIKTSSFTATAGIVGCKKNPSSPSILSDLNNGSDIFSVNNVSIRRHTSRRLKHSKTAKVLGFATLAFAFTWLPYWLFEFGLLKEKLAQMNLSTNSTHYLQVIMLKFLKNSFYLNYVLNSLFYSFVNRPFRRSLRIMIKKLTKFLGKAYYFVLYVFYKACCCSFCCFCCLNRFSTCYNCHNLLQHRFYSFNFNNLWTRRDVGVGVSGVTNKASGTTNGRRNTRTSRHSRLNSTRSDLTNESVVYEISSIVNSEQGLFCALFERISQFLIFIFKCRDNNSTDSKV